MAVDPGSVARLRRMTAEPYGDEFTDTELQEYLDTYAVTSHYAGVTTIAYDFHAAAADVWETKMASADTVPAADGSFTSATVGDIRVERPNVSGFYTRKVDYHRARAFARSVRLIGPGHPRVSGRYIDLIDPSVTGAYMRDGLPVP